MKHTPRFLKYILNIYPPFLGSGIRVDHISSDWKEVRVSLRLRWYNRNISGTHFGGSLYSMTDPHFALMLMHLLGDNYIVWDKRAEIDYLRPGTGTVSATFQITDDQLQTIKEQTDLHRRYLPEFTAIIVGEDGSEVARIRKTLYVRIKKRAASSNPE
ncbi:MAG: DUF4442 domain-containing protein [Desulfocapsaceae bacterium]|jgi:acyl-coenzyme A thioesterase PaaI-like protein|nr:DUF4442 domain-containing protein [Desulfocapsaceae bacterium]